MALAEQANKYKIIYSTYPSYMNLIESDRSFFDDLFVLILFEKDISWENKYLAERLGYSVSTIEKKLHRLEAAHLIKRKCTPFLDHTTGHWITASRSITLDPVTFTILKASASKTQKETADFIVNNINETERIRKQYNDSTQPRRKGY